MGHLQAECTLSLMEAIMPTTNPFLGYTSTIDIRSIMGHVEEHPTAYFLKIIQECATVHSSNISHFYPEGTRFKSRGGPAVFLTLSWKMQ
jgi:hypothetical protein